MNTFNKKSLYTALAGLGVLGATGAAQAVNLNPNGLGQALIYPYYTTRSDANNNAYNSLLSVVNSTGSAKAVKVRFLEGKNSREVLDFNLFLSANDVWTTAIIPSGANPPTSSNNTGGGRIITADRSCTIPAIPAGGQDFVNYQYSASNDDKGGTGLDRTREGYVEIIEMATFASTSTTYKNITHVNGVPPGCAVQTDAQATKDAQPLSGGLFGGLSLINVNNGTDYTEDAVALDNFNTVQTLYNAASSPLPDLQQSAPPVSQVLANNNVYTSAWTGGSTVPADPVSAVLMHDQVMNEFVLDTVTRSGTDWVVTFPTKKFYVNVGTGNAPRLFQRNFNATAGACDDVSLSIYDREEQTTSTPVSFSPPPPVQTNALCWEANVVTFNNSNVLASANIANIPTSFQNGWLRMGFFPSSVTGAVHTLPNTGATSITAIGGGTTAAQSVTYFGLPVVGFAVQNFVNGNVGGVLSNYGGNFVQKTTTRIQ